MSGKGSGALVRRARDCAPHSSGGLTVRQILCGRRAITRIAERNACGRNEGRLHPCGMTPSLTRAGLTCPVPRFRVWPDPFETLLWQQDGVDDVDHTVAAKDVGFDDVGVVDHNGAAVGMNG